MFIELEDVALRVVTLVVDRFEVPVTFRVPPRTEEAFRVVTLVVERFEVPVTFMDVEKRLTAFIIVAFPLV
jgi:hypothetical protein